VRENGKGHFAPKANTALVWKGKGREAGEMSGPLRLNGNVAQPRAGVGRAGPCGGPGPAACGMAALRRRWAKVSLPFRAHHPLGA